MISYYERIVINSNKLFETFIYILRHEDQTNRVHLGLGFESELEKSHMLCEQIHCSYLMDRAHQILATGKVFKTDRLRQYFDGETFYIPPAITEHDTLADTLALGLISAIPEEWKMKQTNCLGTNEFEGLQVHYNYDIPTKTS